MGVAADGRDHAVSPHRGAVGFSRRKFGANALGGRQELWSQRTAVVPAGHTAGGFAASFHRVPPRSGSRIHRHGGRRNGGSQTRTRRVSLAFVADPAHRRDVRWTNADWLSGNLSHLWLGSARRSVDAMASRSATIEGTALMAWR